MSIQNNKTRNGQTPTEQDILNQSFDAEIQVLAFEIVGSPEAIGASPRHMYGTKVSAQGGLAVANTDGTQMFSGLVPEHWDSVAVTYVSTSDRINTATYFIGATQICVITVGYDGQNRINSIVRT